jgi:hypothetical protein
MCVQCVTNTEFLVVNGAVATAAVTHGVRRVGASLGLIDTGTREERKASAHMEDVAFVASLGLDPDVVLGRGPEEPSPPVTSPSPVE